MTMADLYTAVGIAQAILWLVAAYAAIGIVFALLFVWRGVERIDPAARGVPWSVRALLLPGAVALWPTLAARWRRATHNHTSGS